MISLRALKCCVMPMYTISRHACGGEAKDMQYMKLALRHAQAAYREKEIPIGTVIVDNSGIIMAATRGKSRRQCDAAAQSEMECLKAAFKVSRNPMLNGCTIYTTLEPCTSVFEAISKAGLSRIVYGAPDIMSKWREVPMPSGMDVTGGILEEDCSSLLRGFYSTRKNINDKDGEYEYFMKRGVGFKESRVGCVSK
jgi:tRNA(adenine34) deaminase